MATRKPTSDKKKATKRTEFRFVMDAYTPDTIPMSRLGAYLSELATLMGEDKFVHFRDLIKGSTIPLVDVEHEAVPKVRARLVAVSDGDGPPEAMRARDNINRFLREDNATGKLLEKRKAVLAFPGRLEKIERPIAIRQHGTIEGELVRIGGTDESIHAILKSEGQKISHITMTRTIAKRLGPKLFDFVRLIGHGRWDRSGDGTWTLMEFTVEDFVGLERSTLTGALDELRAVGTGWENVENAFQQLRALRGKEGDPDARH